MLHEQTESWKTVQASHSSAGEITESGVAVPQQWESRGGGISCWESAGLTPVSITTYFSPLVCSHHLPALFALLVAHRLSPVCPWLLWGCLSVVLPLSTFTTAATDDYQPFQSVISSPSCLTAELCCCLPLMLSGKIMKSEGMKWSYCLLFHYWLHSLFSRVCCHRTRGNCSRLKERRFWLDILFFYN